MASSSSSSSSASLDVPINLNQNNEGAAPSNGPTKREGRPNAAQGRKKKNGRRKQSGRTRINKSDPIAVEYSDVLCNFS